MLSEHKVVAFVYIFYFDSSYFLKSTLAKELAEQLGMLHMPEFKMDDILIDRYGNDMRKFYHLVSLSSILRSCYLIGAYFTPWAYAD